MAMFLRDQIRFSYFVEGNLVTISTKLQCILNSYYRFQREDLHFFCFCDKPRPLAAMFLMDHIWFSYFIEGRHLVTISIK